eukprot:364692-Chlamydomonas_euryale.AAC.23
MEAAATPHSWPLPRSADRVPSDSAVRSAYAATWWCGWCREARAASRTVGAVLEATEEARTEAVRQARRRGEATVEVAVTEGREGARRATVDMTQEMARWVMVAVGVRRLL